MTLTVDHNEVLMQEFAAQSRREKRSPWIVGSIIGVAASLAAAFAVYSANQSSIEKDCRDKVGREHTGTGALAAIARTNAVEACIKNRP